MKFQKGNKIGKQFTSENQPENKGRPKKSVSDWLKEYGEAEEINFKIVVSKNGEEKVQQGAIKSETSINNLIAVTILKNAIQGDSKAISTLLDRTEGKVPQNHKHSGDEDNPVHHEVNINVVSTGFTIANSEDQVNV